MSSVPRPGFLHHRLDSDDNPIYTNPLLQAALLGDSGQSRDSPAAGTAAAASAGLAARRAHFAATAADAGNMNRKSYSFDEEDVEGQSPHRPRVRGDAASTSSGSGSGTEASETGRGYHPPDHAAMQLREASQHYRMNSDSDSVAWRYHPHLSSESAYADTHGYRYASKDEGEYRDEGQSTESKMHTFTSFSSRFNRFSSDIYHEETKSEKHRMAAVAVILAVSLALILILFTGTTGQSPTASNSNNLNPTVPPTPSGPADPALDVLRPQYHLMPPKNWMNDPCGPGYIVTPNANSSLTVGMFHLFYQCNPSAPMWGNMHWCHASSPDSIFWTNQPIALAPGTQNPGVYPDPAPTMAPSQPPSFIGSDRGVSGSGGSATIAGDDIDDIDSGMENIVVRARSGGLELGKVPQFQTPTSYDNSGVFSGGILFGGITNGSVLHSAAGLELGYSNASTVATAFYTGVSAPFNVSDPYSTATLKDGTNLLIEVQAAAITTDASLDYWNKRISVKPKVPPNKNKTTETLNPLISAPPLPYTARQISGFRDPSVSSSAANAHNMVIGSGFLSNTTLKVFGGGAVFTYFSNNLMQWGFSGILFQANHTFADTNSTRGSGVSKQQSSVGITAPDTDRAAAAEKRRVGGVGTIEVDPVSTDEMWECPDLFELPVSNAPAMGKMHVLLYGSKYKVVYHIGQLVPIADAVGPQSVTYPRGNNTFVSYVTGVLDAGYFYAARSQAYTDNTNPNNKNTYNNGRVPSGMNAVNSRLLWGWVNEAAYRSTAQTQNQGWAGVMSLPRTLTLEYHGGANAFTHVTSYTADFPARNFMYNGNAFLTSSQQASKTTGAAGFQLVASPSPAIQTLRTISKTGTSANHTVDFGAYPTPLDAADAVYNTINIYDISVDFTVSLKTPLASFSMKLLDLNGVHFAFINVTTVTDYTAASGTGTFAHTTLTVGNNHLVENKCDSLFGFKAPTNFNAADNTFAYYAANSAMELRVILDGSIMEVFLNNRCSITQRIYTVPAYRNHPLKMLIAGANNTLGLNAVQKVQSWAMKPISNNRLTTVPSAGHIAT